jgi:hypothetical protein
MVAVLRSNPKGAIKHVSKFGDHVRTNHYEVLCICNVAPWARCFGQR